MRLTIKDQNPVTNHVTANVRKNIKALIKHINVNNIDVSQRQVFTIGRGIYGIEKVGTDQYVVDTTYNKTDSNVLLKTKSGGLTSKKYKTHNTYDVIVK